MQHMSNYIELTKGDEKIVMKEYRIENPKPIANNLDDVYYYILEHYTDGVKVFSDKLGYYEGRDFIDSQELNHGYKMNAFLLRLEA